MSLRAIFVRLVNGLGFAPDHLSPSGAPASRVASSEPPDPPSARSPTVSPMPPEGVPASDSHRVVFTSIYANEFWRRGGESRSGPGSRREATKRLRWELPELISCLRVKRMLDIGCGDFNWMREMQLSLELYIGVDTVFDVVLANRLRYGDVRRWFLMRDLTQHPLPRADLVLCRDVLIHFPDADLVRAMQDNSRHRRALLAHEHVRRPESQRSDCPRRLAPGQSRVGSAAAAPTDGGSGRDNRLSPATTTSVWVCGILTRCGPPPLNKPATRGGGRRPADCLIKACCWRNAAPA